MYTTTTTTTTTTASTTTTYSGSLAIDHMTTLGRFLSLEMSSFITERWLAKSAEEKMSKAAPKKTKIKTVKMSKNVISWPCCEGAADSKWGYGFESCHFTNWIHYNSNFMDVIRG